MGPPQIYHHKKQPSPVLTSNRYTFADPLHHPNMETTTLLYIIIGLLAAVVLYVVWLYGGLRKARESLAHDAARAAAESAALYDQVQRLAAENSALRDEQLRLRQENAVQAERLAAQADERRRLEEQYTLQFNNLANKIFDEKSQKFTDLNSRNIEALLKPLGERIQEFHNRIDKEGEQRIRLEEEIKRLHDFSNQVSSQANNLASALRGNSKAQGDWGEIILEQMLENCGLRRGEHFLVQHNLKDAEGHNLRPDIVLRLPEGRNMIIDSKVSLTDYVTYTETPESDTAARETAIKAHVASLRRHVAELAAQSYHALVEGSPDFVIMFVPNEAAFLTAMDADRPLWNDAYKRNVVLSSPANLLALLQLVQNLWRRDDQDRNALEIARQGGALYDKFVGFTENLLAVGDALGRTERLYNDAIGQLREGRGNLVRRAEELHKLGIKATKRLSARLTGQADDDEPGLLVPLSDDGSVVSEAETIADAGKE